MSRGRRFTLSSMRRIHLFLFFSLPFPLPFSSLDYLLSIVSRSIFNYVTQVGGGWLAGTPLTILIKFSRSVDRRKTWRWNEEKGEGMNAAAAAANNGLSSIISFDTSPRRLIKKPLRLHLRIIFKRFSASAAA